MSNYVELKAKADELFRQAEEVRHAEMAGVVAEIREKMLTYNLTLEDIGGKPAAKRGARASAEEKVIRYRGPNGETWSGGLGRKPEWIRQLIAANQDIEQYRVA